MPFGFNKRPAVPSARHSAPARTPEQVPAGLVSLTKAAAVSLDKVGLTGQRAAVYLVVDRSMSMAGFYDNGSVQHLADQALGLAVNLDDDGTVPLVMFDSQPYPIVDIDLNSYQGAVAEQHRLHGGRATMRGTCYAPAMRTVMDHHKSTGAQVPALVIFQTDGDPQDKAATEMQLRDASKLPLFWSFVGYGQTVPFLQGLDNLSRRTVDNASYFHAGQPTSLSDAALYEGITREYPSWLAAANAARILP